MSLRCSPAQLALVFLALVAFCAMAVTAHTVDHSAEIAANGRVTSRYTSSYSLLAADEHLETRQPGNHEHNTHDEDDEDTQEHDEGVCGKVDFTAYLARADDGFKLMFEPESEKVKVGFVDVVWSLTPAGERGARPTEYRFRMDKTEENLFENVLRYSDADAKLKLKAGDKLRYFFSFWAVPDEHGDQGADCYTDVHWFAVPEEGLELSP